MADAREDRRVRDLVAIEVQDRQHRAVAYRVDELVGVPRRGKRPGLGLAVSDDAGDDQVGVVERHAIGVRQAVAKLTAFVNGAGRFRRDVAADMAGKGKLLEELLHPLDVRALVRVDLGVRAFEVSRSEHAGRSVARARHEEDVEIVSDDQSVQVHPDKRECRTGAPVSEQPMLDVVRLQRFAQQRVVFQVDHPYRQVVARPPVGVMRASCVSASGCDSRSGCAT